MDLLEQRVLVELLIKELKEEQGEHDIDAQPGRLNDDKKDS